MIGVTLLILFVIVFTTQDINNIVDVILKVNPVWLLVAIGCMFMYWGLEALILYIVTLNTGVQCRFRDILDVSMVGQLFNCITPFASGGQPMQAYYMIQRNMPLSTATASLMGKFIVYQVTLIIYSTVLMIARFAYFTANVSGFTYLTLIGYLVNFAVMGFFFAVIYFNKPTIKIIQWGTKVASKMKLVKHPEKMYKKIDNGVKDFSIGFFSLMRDKRLLVRSFLLSVAQLTFYMIIPYFIALAFGLSGMDIITLLAAQSFVMCISSFMPLPGGSGAAEGSFYVFFSMFFGAGTGVAMLLWRFITYYLMIVVGAIFSVNMGLTSGEKIAEMEEKANKLQADK